MKAIVALPYLLLASCAAPTSITQTGPDTFLATRSSRAGAFTDTSKLKGDVIRDANAYAARHGKITSVISTDERRPIIGGFPSYEYQFRMVEP